MNTIKSNQEKVKEESWKKVQPPLEVPSREQDDEYISINDDPKEIETPQS